MESIETKRLLLRPFTEADVPEYAEFCADEQVMRFVGRGNTLTVDETWRKVAFYLGHWQLRGYGQWAMVEKSSQDFVGRVGLHHPHGWLGLEVGWLVGPAFWGRGYATEGGRASIDFAFNQLGKEQLISCMRPENQASIRVAQKLGMRFDRKDIMLDEDALVYELHSTQWDGR